MSKGMPDFEAWAVFARIAERLSFVGAAEDLGISGATASKALARLECRLGVTLVHRTTRRLSLTPIGEAFAARASGFLSGAAELEDAARDEAAAPQGLVRMAAPLSFGLAHVVPLLEELFERLPGIQLDLTLDDALTDIVDDGVDLAIRIGWPRDSALKARRLGEARTPLVAAPSYIARMGAPSTPADLSRHEAISYANLSPAGRWTLRGEAGDDVTVAVENRLVTNSGEAMLAMLRAGLGVAMMPLFLAAGDLASGALVRVLPGWSCRPAGVYLLMPNSGPRPSRVSAVADLLAERLPVAIRGI